jgi:hypothetical protein
MSIKLLRWRSGSGGDTVLKLILDSNPSIHSQNKYVTIKNGKTLIDSDYVKLFKYQQIANMSLKNATDVDLKSLVGELNSLEQDNPSINWLLKTHCYYEFPYKVIDIVVDHTTLPFVINASLSKNSRKNNAIPDYHPMIYKIKDASILYKFDCYNMIADIVNNTIVSDQKIFVKDIIGGWGSFKQSLSNVNLYISPQCQTLYNNWFADNQQFMPSQDYTRLVNEQNYDYTNSSLTVVEKYCLLGLLNKKFMVLE